MRWTVTEVHDLGATPQKHARDLCDVARTALGRVMIMQLAPDDRVRVQHVCRVLDELTAQLTRCHDR